MRAAAESGAARWLLAIAALVLVAHLPFALLAGPFFDGWQHVQLFERGDVGGARKILVNAGRPLGAWLTVGAMEVTGRGHGAVWLSVLFIVAAACGWFLALMRTGLVSPRLSFAMAVICAVSPASQLVVVTPAIHFFAAHAFFSLGLWLYLCAPPSAWRPAAYAAACICAVLSALWGEATTAMLLLYPLTAWVAGERSSPSRSRRWLYLVHAWFPVALGVVAFVANSLLWPPVASYVLERRLTFDAVQLVLSAATFAATLLLVYLPLLSVMMWQRKRDAGLQAVTDGRKNLLFALALATAILSIGPFVVALRLASPTGWGVRYLYFFGSSLAWLLAALVVSRDDKGRRTLDVRDVSWVVLAVSAALLLRWPFMAARAVQEDIVSAAAAQSAVIRSSHVVLVEDSTGHIGAPLRDMEWSGLLQRAVGKPREIAGIELVREDTAWSRWRLALRRRMKWAQEAVDVPMPVEQQLRERVSVLEGIATLVTLPQDCRSARLRIAPITWSHGAAMVWQYLGSAVQPASYQGWLREQAAHQVLIDEMSPLSPCR